MPTIPAEPIAIDPTAETTTGTAVIGPTAAATPPLDHHPSQTDEDKDGHQQGQKSGPQRHARLPHPHGH
ncbi:MAG: hypothetical protein QGH25_02695, partial [Candidatus Latescibacteria bacterium]|nr:hypothetical protein [Candidatus Latescibacterota bacterium]